MKGPNGVEIQDLVLPRAGKAELAELRTVLEGADLAILRRQSLTDEELIWAVTGLSSAPALVNSASGAVEHISNLTDEKGRPLGAEDYAADTWEFCSGADSERRYRLLYVIETPPSGGSLHFCDLDSALSALAPARRRPAEAAKIERKLPTLLRQLLGAGRGITPEPLIFYRRDGRLGMRLPREWERISGLDAESASAFVTDLLKDLTEEVHCVVHDWGPGDLLIWDRDRFLRRRDPSTGVYLMKTLCSN